LEPDTGQWHTAWSWGDHATAGYLTNYTETDPIWTNAQANGFTVGGQVILPTGGLTVGSTQLIVLANGNVGIGTATPTNELAVNGTIKAKEVIVSLDGWPDYVFEKDYDLMSLSAVNDHIREHGHLPGVPSAREVQLNGIKMGEMQATLLQKIEELTLHMIELKRENRELRQQLDGASSLWYGEAVSEPQ